MKLNKLSEFRLSKQEMIQVKGGDPEITKYRCTCQNDTNKSFNLYIEAFHQLSDALTVCNGPANCYKA